MSLVHGVVAHFGLPSPLFQGFLLRRLNDPHRPVHAGCQQPTSSGLFASITDNLIGDQRLIGIHCDVLHQDLLLPFGHDVGLVSPRLSYCRGNPEEVFASLDCVSHARSGSKPNTREC